MPTHSHWQMFSCIVVIVSSFKHLYPKRSLWWKVRKLLEKETKNAWNYDKKIKESVRVVGQKNYPKPKFFGFGGAHPMLQFQRVLIFDLTHPHTHTLTHLQRWVMCEDLTTPIAWDGRRLTRWSKSAGPNSSLNPFCIYHPKVFF